MVTQLRKFRDNSSRHYTQGTASAAPRAEGGLTVVVLNLLPWRNPLNVAGPVTATQRTRLRTALQTGFRYCFLLFCPLFNKRKKKLLCIVNNGTPTKYKELGTVQAFTRNCHCKIFIFALVQNRATLSRSSSIQHPISSDSGAYLRNREMLAIKVDIFIINFNLLFLKSYFCLHTNRIWSTTFFC